MISPVVIFVHSLMNISPVMLGRTGIFLFNIPSVNCDASALAKDCEREL
jgi:hypothetical protein